VSRVRDWFTGFDCCYETEDGQEFAFHIISGWARLWWKLAGWIVR
jgi:hypothetical protein